MLKFCWLTGYDSGSENKDGMDLAQPELLQTIKDRSRSASWRMSRWNSLMRWTTDFVLWPISGATGRNRTDSAEVVYMVCHWYISFQKLIQVANDWLLIPVWNSWCTWVIINLWLRLTCADPKILRLCWTRPRPIWWHPNLYFTSLCGRHASNCVRWMACWL